MSFQARARREADILVAISFALLLGGPVSGCSSGTGLTTAKGGAGGATPDGGGTGGSGAGGSQPDAGLDGPGVEVPAPTPIVVPTPTFAASRPSADCTATLATPIAPLLLDATISCAGGGGPTALAAGAQGAGFVAVGATGSTASTRVLSLSAQGVVSGDQGPDGAIIAGLVAEPAGGVDLVSLAGGVNFFHAVDGGWMRELLAPPGPPMAAPTERFDFDAAGRSPDGRVNLVYDHWQDSYAEVSMSTRSAEGSWTALPLPPFIAWRNSAMAVPPAGAAILVHDHLPSSASLQLDAWSGGLDSALVSLPKASDGSDDIQSVGAAVDAVGTLTASFETHGQGVVIVRPAGTSPRTVAIAGTQMAVPVGCPDWPRTSPTALPSMTCTQTGTGGSGRQALIATGGTIWVAYLLTHMDRDVFWSCAPSFSGGSFDCGGEITIDRSTSELVLERLAADDGHAVRWRTSVGVGDAVFFMGADGGATRLLLAFSPSPPSAGKPTFRYVALDATAP